MPYQDLTYGSMIYTAQIKMTSSETGEADDADYTDLAGINLDSGGDNPFWLKFF